MTRAMAETPEVAHCWNFCASCSLDSSFPSMHRATRVARLGSLAKMACASFSSAALICAWEGALGSFSSGSSSRVSLQ